MRRPSQPELQLLIDVAALVSDGIATIWPERDHDLAEILRGGRNRTFYRDRDGRFYREDGEAAGTENCTAADISPLPEFVFATDDALEYDDAIDAYQAEVVVRVRFPVAGQRDAQHARIAAIANIEDFAERLGCETDFLTIEVTPEPFRRDWPGADSLRTA